MEMLVCILARCCLFKSHQSNHVHTALVGVNQSTQLHDRKADWLETERVLGRKLPILLDLPVSIRLGSSPLDLK